MFPPADVPLIVKPLEGSAPSLDAFWAAYSYMIRSGLVLEFIDHSEDDGIRVERKRTHLVASKQS